MKKGASIALIRFSECILYVNIYWIMSNVLKAESLTKNFGEIRAVDNLNFELSNLLSM